MQWLIDLIIEAIGIPPVYIDRGPFTDNDWDETDLAQDTLWHELDMSGVIPDGAQAVNLHFRGVDANVGRILFMRPAGDFTVVGTCFVRNQVANIAVGGFITMSISADRKVEYRSLAPGFTTINFKVRGWWL